MPGTSQPQRLSQDRPRSIRNLDKRACLILNPEAGRGRRRGLDPQLAKAAERLGWDVEIRLTTHAGHERDLAAEAADEHWPLIVAIGGDGTVHGVANGILSIGSGTSALAHVPIGTGNDFAKILGLSPGDAAGNLTSIFTQGRIRRLDVGRVLDEYFINGMGVGFDAEVIRHMLDMTRLRGFLLYLAAVYKTFWSFKPTWLEVASAEHAESGKMMMLEVSIGTSAGGGFRLTPEALPDDGLFDVCIIRPVGAAQFLLYVPRVIKGTHVTLPQVTIFRTSELTVQGLNGPFALHLDGELRVLDDVRAEITLVPGALAVVCVP